MVDKLQGFEDRSSAFINVEKKGHIYNIFTSF